MHSMKHLATVRDLTGQVITLGMFEEVTGLKVEDNLVTVGLDCAKVKNIRGGDVVIYKRGKVILTFHQNDDGSWTRRVAFAEWWSTDERHGQGSRSRDVEWEELCHRPGTARTPLDNLDRIRQGY